MLIGAESWIKVPIYFEDISNQTVDGPHSIQINSIEINGLSTVWLTIFFKIYYLCSAEERNSYRIGTT